jgi:hypothetical protein
MFSKNPRKTIGTIYDREMERQKNNTNKKEYIQDYLRTTILDNLVTIRESQVARPEFATPEKIREDIEEQSTDILRTLTEFINK